VGKEALVEADPRPRLYGVRGQATPIANDRLLLGDDDVGRVTMEAWSPFLECGIGYVCLHAPGSWLGAELRREDGAVYTIVELPFHDREKAIPRGLAD
jgi:glycine cleavage system aminomethyltransferase T